MAARSAIRQTNAAVAKLKADNASVKRFTQVLCENKVSHQESGIAGAAKTAPSLGPVRRGEAVEILTQVLLDDTECARIPFQPANHQGAFNGERSQ